LFFTKSEIIKQEDVKGTNEIELTFKSIVEIPVKMFMRFEKDLVNDEKLKPLLNKLCNDAMEQAIETMTNAIKPEYK